MSNAEPNRKSKSAFRQLGVPTAVGLVGAAAGLILHRKPDIGQAMSNVGKSVSDLKDNADDLVGDLRQRLESVVTNEGDGSSSQFSTDEIADRRHAREQRRAARRAR